ncbi:hypothetical protein PR048_004963 [Dryococelus australis]|uniref:Uncharacterized protein n=1 Tax=Dryococelus australis TaxID=614101 RepID=A0ABQ9I6V4_9NEOP|nr:hypothetical protein PR048_004963 [Dryococelus australis]
MSPMRCKKCHRYGHTEERCRQKEEICGKCWEEGHTTRTMVQSNLQKARTVTLDLNKQLIEDKYEIALIQEPSLFNNNYTNLNSNYQIIKNEKGQSLVAIIRANKYKILNLQHLITKDIALAKIMINNEEPT